jgi:hypothetical protein
LHMVALSEVRPSMYLRRRRNTSMRGHIELGRA